MIEVATSEDQLGEEDETFRVELSAPNGATLEGDGTGTGTIIDDDGGTVTPPEDTLPKMSIADGTAEEGEAVELAVTLDKESTEVVTVTYRTGDVTATGGEDYTAVATGTLTFQAGERRKVIEVATSEDQLGEEDETFRVELSAPNGATLVGDGTGTGTIIDDDGGTVTPPEDTLPKMSIADGTADEGEVVELAVTLDKESTEVVTVTYRTGDVTATAGEDYTAVAAGTLTFQAGERRKVIEVATSEDQLGEEDETFRVELSGPVGATLVGDGIGTGTIIDDDGGTVTPPEDTLPKMSIADGTAEEGEAVELAVTLDKESTEVVTVTYRTGDVTATAGEDYTALATGTLTFEVGERRKVIEVATSEDQLGEEDETFRVELSAPNGATLEGDGIGTGTIVDDDGGTVTPPEDTLPKMSIADGTADEGEVVELAVTLDKESTEVVTVTYRTGDVTATAGEDYTAEAAGDAEV